MKNFTSKNYAFIFYIIADGIGTNLFTLFFIDLSTMLPFNFEVNLSEGVHFAEFLLKGNSLFIQVTLNHVLCGVLSYDLETKITKYFNFPIFPSVIRGIDHLTNSFALVSDDQIRYFKNGILVKTTKNLPTNNLNFLDLWKESFPVVKLKDIDRSLTIKIEIRSTFAAYQAGRKLYFLDFVNVKDYFV